MEWLQWLKNMEWWLSNGLFLSLLIIFLITLAKKHKERRRREEYERIISTLRTLVGRVKTRSGLKDEVCSLLAGIFLDNRMSSNEIKKIRLELEELKKIPGCV